MKNNRGAITVFMALAFAVMFLFSGMVIDFSRILLARYTVQTASEAATRSLMAGYDKNLMADYGLYAIQKDEENNLNTYKKYLNSNLGISNAETPEEKPYFSILKFDENSVKETKVELDVPIWQDEEFKKQVMEYEEGRKWAFAIQEGISILSGFFSNKVLGQIRSADAANTSQVNVKKKAGVFDNLAAKTSFKINAKLSEINYQENEEIVHNIVREVFGAAGSVSENLSKSVLKELFKQNLKYKGDSLKKGIGGISSDDLTNTLASLEQTIEDLEASLNKAEADIGAAEAVNDTSNADGDTDVRDYVNNIDGLNIEATREKIEKSRNSIQECRGAIEQAKNDTQLYVNDYNVMIDIYMCAEYARSIANDESINAERGVLVEYIKDEFNAANQLLKKVNITDLNVRGESIADGSLIREIQNKFRLIVGAHNDIINNLESYEITPIGTISIPEAKEDYPGKAEQQANEKEVSDGIDSLKEQLDIYASNDFGELFRGENAQKRFSQPVGIWDGLGDIFAAIPVVQLVPMIADVIETISDDTNLDYNISLTCYIMEKTNNITSAARRDHFFKYGETEYIKYGWDKQWENNLNSILDILSFRYTVNFVYYFVKTPGGIIARLIGAASLGGVQTAIDGVGLFVSGDGCKVIPNTGPEFTYSDHLMLKIFFESSKKAKLLDTMQATLMQRDKTGKANLKEMYTTVKTHCAVDVDLIFMKLFGFELIDFADFNDGKYTVNVDLVMSY